MDQYRSYFLHQATAHPDLLHTDTDKIFRVISIEEALGDFRAGIEEKGWMFRLIEYKYRPALDDSGRYLKRYQGGFVLAKSYSPRSGGEAARQAAQDDAERVTDELIEKMVIDSIAGHPLWEESLNSRQQIDCQTTGTTGDLSYVGWRTIFSWDNTFRNCIPSSQLPAWTDGGVTPFEL